MSTTGLRNWSGVFVVLCCSVSAYAGAHTWDVNEIFSNADGTIQFVEMHNPAGNPNEIFLNNRTVASASTGSVFTFPSNLPAGSTSDAHILLATTGFAALPGAPTPDHIIPDNFFDVGGDSIIYTPYDTMTFGAGVLPLDGVNSLHDTGAGTSVGVNSPTNFSGQTGSVVVPCNPADFDNSGSVNAADLALLLGSWGPCAGCPADLNADGVVNAADLALLLGAWGPC